MQKFLISTLFVDEEREELWARLNKWLTNMSSKNPIDLDMILRMHEGREDQINWEKVPPDLGDFPSDIQIAISIYGKLSDNIIPDIGYMGKNWELLELLMEIDNVSNKSLCIEALLRLDQFYIEKSRKDMERAKKNKSGKN